MSDYTSKLGDHSKQNARLYGDEFTGSSRKPPKFQPEEKVRYGGSKNLATVVKCINQAEPGDVELQGYRYYVHFGGEYWSVPENRLRPISKRA